jgi:hypothetical protein
MKEGKLTDISDIQNLLKAQFKEWKMLKESIIG